MPGRTMKRLSLMGGLALSGLTLWNCQDAKPEASPPTSNPSVGGGSHVPSSGSGGQERAGGGHAAGGAPTGAGGSSNLASGGAGAAAGQAGTPNAPETCGNGKLDPNEACDANSFAANQTCKDHGFDAGTLLCTACAVDTTPCTGIEACTDGRDNDGDGLVDCTDTGCQEVCASSCPPTVSLEPTSNNVVGSNATRPSELTPGCLQSTVPSGSEIVYEVITKVSGVLGASLTSDSDLSLSVRKSCAVANSEVVCSDLGAGKGAHEHVTVPVTAGEKLYVVVDGSGTSEAGPFRLDLTNHAVVCGDGARDPGEECDDANLMNDDGCTAQCKVESTEGEPNGTPQTAAPLTQPFYGTLPTYADVDVVKLQIATTGTKLLVKTFDYGDGACALGRMDPALELFGADGTTLIAEDDDSGDGLCARLEAPTLSAGTYYLAVTAKEGAPQGFPYELNVTTTAPP